ncbi:hypothetical protein COU80_04200 [Candidatus Peregrinibacteria bacterium CG10_big_fil_rev_8_21_14_0_10_55_24]|nr:MAG: hypothetical protein COU80_04200 [Candidatus Peregrinibacteria bacterium CG10_big_fil_rev_8_21_14_0_10_55_24]
MRPRLLLAGILIGNLNLSLCIGGLFNASLTLAASLPPQEPDTVAMTPAFIGYDECRQEAPEEQGKQLSNTGTSPCSDTKECLANAHSLLPAPLTLFSAHEYAVFLPEDAKPDGNTNDPHRRPTARAGPLFSFAPQHARFIAKLE